MAQRFKECKDCLDGSPSGIENCNLSKQENAGKDNGGITTGFDGVITPSKPVVIPPLSLPAFSCFDKLQFSIPEGDPSRQSLHSLKRCATFPPSSLKESSGYLVSSLETAKSILRI